MSIKKSLKNKANAFTLAEVLITIGIIGIVAAITIPTIIKNYQDAALKSALQKEVAVLSQVTTKIAQNNGGSIQGVFGGGVNNYLNFVNHLSYAKLCTTTTNIGECWHQSGAWYRNNGTQAYELGASFYTQNAGLILNDGSLLLISSQGSPTCSGIWMHMENSGMGSTDLCSVVFIDVNGFKGPNRTGKDIFALSLKAPATVTPSVYNPQNTGIDCAGKILAGQTCP